MEYATKFCELKTADRSIQWPENRFLCSYCLLAIYTELYTNITHTHPSQWSHLLKCLAKTLGCKLFPIYYNVSCCVSEYPGNVSVWHLRFFPAFLSALTVPVIYEIMVELRTARWTASLAAALFILGKGLFTLDGLARSRTLYTR